MDVDTLIAEHAGPIEKPTYESVGNKPNRRMSRKVGGQVELMMSEIAPGLFVGWDTCLTCHRHVSQCQCTGGPTEPAHAVRWRKENEATRLAKFNPGF